MRTVNTITKFVQYLRGEADEQTSAEVQALRGSSPERERDLQQLKETIALTKLLSEKSIPQVSARATDEIMRRVRLQREIDTPRSPTLLGLRWLAAGVSFALVLMVVFRSGQEIPIAPVPINAVQSHQPGPAGMSTNYNDFRIANSVTTILAYLEGSFGALIFLVTGLAGLTCLRVGTIKRDRRLVYLGFALLFLALMTFLLRGMMTTFFNAESIPDE